MYFQIDPTGNSGTPLTTVTGQFYAPGSPSNKITIVDAEPGALTILGGTDHTLDCAIVADAVTQGVKVLSYNQSTQSGGVFATVTALLAA